MIVWFHNAFSLSGWDYFYIQATKKSSTSASLASAKCDKPEYRTLKRSPLINSTLANWYSTCPPSFNGIEWLNIQSRSLPSTCRVTPPTLFDCIRAGRSPTTAWSTWSTAFQIWPPSASPAAPRSQTTAWNWSPRISASSAAWICPGVLGSQTWP